MSERPTIRAALDAMALAQRVHANGQTTAPSLLFRSERVVPPGVPPGVPPEVR